MNPTGFLRAALPFLETAGTDADVPMFVPIAQLVGESWRWSAESVPAADRAARVAFFLHPDRADESKPHPAEYFSWPDIGLYAAFEGKNRVALLRSAGVVEVPASVSMHPYPSPARIRLYNIAAGDAQDTVAVLDGRWVARPPLLRLGLPVLSAYGVPPPKPWPKSFPNARDVVSASPSALGTRIDLHPLQRAAKAAEAPVPVSLLDVPGLRPQMAEIGKAAVGTVACMLASGAIGGCAYYVAAACFGALIGAAFAMVLPWFRARHGWLNSL